MNDEARPTGSETILLDAAMQYLQAISGGTEHRSKPLCVIVHQFSHTPLYAPVYMALEALRRHCRNGEDSWLTLEYRSTFSDRRVLEAVGSAGSRRNNGCLHLGVSEVDALAAAKDLVSKPFVKRLPLWGVALRGNRRIALVKAALSPRQQAFNDMFSGKLSVLRPADFAHGVDGAPIRFSIYDKGSTAYRLFMEVLPPGADTRCVVVNEDDDFGPLLANAVDVALTVQPWRGMRIAEGAGHRLELVYTHLSRPEPISSIYMSRDTQDHVGVTRNFIDVLGALVQYNVAQLYAGASLREAHGSYCEAGARCDEVRGAAMPDEVQSPEAFDLALQLLSDSRVYFHELGDSDARRQLLAARLEQSVACHFDRLPDRDRIYILSNHVVRVQETGLNWHRSGPDDRLSGFLAMPEYAGIGKAFADFGRGFSARVDDGDTPQARKEAWRLIDPEELVRHCGFTVESGGTAAFTPWRLMLDRHGSRIDAVRNGTAAPPGSMQVEFCPWIHPAIRSEVFMHLNAQFRTVDGRRAKPRLLRAGRLRAGVLVLAAHPGDAQHPPNYEGLSWLWLEYDGHEPQATPNNKFMNSLSGRIYLNMWRVNHCDKPALARVYRRAQHGQFLMDSDGALWLRARGSETLIADRLDTHFGLLLTFRVRGQVC